MRSAVCGSESHWTLWKPSSFAIQFSIPQFGLSSARHISPTTIGVSNIGRIRIPRTSVAPRSFWLKKRASAVPSTTWIATAPKVKTKVCSTVCQNSGSEKSCR